MTENEVKTIIASLPEEAKSLLQVLARNNMIPPHKCSGTIGQSIKEAIILVRVRDFVRMEYLVLDQILMRAHFKVVARSLFYTKSCIYDHVIIEVAADKGVIKTLDYYFDISYERT